MFDIPLPVQAYERSSEPMEILRNSILTGVMDQRSYICNADWTESDSLKRLLSSSDHTDHLFFSYKQSVKTSLVAQIATSKGSGIKVHNMRLCSRTIKERKLYNRVGKNLCCTLSSY